MRRRSDAARSRAVRRGQARASIAALLGIPEEALRKWLDVYGSAGIEVLAMMGKRHAACSFETKAAAVRAVVDGGMTNRTIRVLYMISISPEKTSVAGPVINT